MSEARFPECLRVMADFGSSDIWVAEPCGPFRHGMIEYKKLGLLPDRATPLAAWIEIYWTRAERRSLEVAAFNDEGRSLAVALKQYVGPNTKVIFEPELETGGLGQPEIIES